MHMSQNPRRVIGSPMGFGLAAVTVLAFAAPGAASAANPDPDPGTEVTFAKDVAPILQENCQVCHQPGSIGPMSLMTYEEVRPWARLIQVQTESRNMPPYHLETYVGIQDIKNDWRLSEEEIATIAAWVEAGAPLGDPADLPAPVEWPDYREWRLSEELGPPDLVLRTPKFDVPPEGGDMFFNPQVPTGLTEDRYMKAIEVKPSYPAGRSVVHHAVPTLRILNDEGELVSGGILSEFAMGKVGEIFPADGARLMPAGSEVRWDVHYYPTGEDVVGDQIELGVWFHDEGEEPQYPHHLRQFGLQGDIAIPPHGTAMTQGTHYFDHPVRIDSFQAHGHLRLVAKQIEALYPDGTREILSKARFNARWHHSYIYEDGVAPLLPTGTTLLITAWYDNTENNPLNPDPDVWVSRGARTTDEMSHAWISWTDLTEEYYEELVAKRGDNRYTGTVTATPEQARVRQDDDQDTN
jgi:mono/diheme cytochrome c family protein